MLTELMDNYGPVNRFWFDGGPANVKPDPQSRPAGVTSPLVYSRAAELIRSHSPSTLISPYRGDVCSTTETLYTRDQPQPNSTDSTGCVDPDESGKYFHPSEMHGITMQEGNDGNTDARPTYWFWHDWACAGNVTGCPWVGHANVSRALIQLNACPLFFWTFTFIIHICIYVGPDLYLPSLFIFPRLFHPSSSSSLLAARLLMHLRKLTHLLPTIVLSSFPDVASPPTSYMHAFICVLEGFSNLQFVYCNCWTRIGLEYEHPANSYWSDERFRSASDGGSGKGDK